MPSSHLEGLIHRVRQGLSAVELVHLPHECWPLPRHAADATRRLKISILDSSFNPPTLAHLALASVPAPKRPDALDAGGHADFDARLLLLSVRNADKSLKPSDASYTQRLEMMILLAEEIAAQKSPRAEYPGEEPLEDPNVAVAIIDEPTFVGKSRILHEYLHSRLASFSSAGSRSSTPSLPGPLSVPKPEFTFVVGIDTLERILAVRYYSTEENMRRALDVFLGPTGDDSRLVCARRVTPGSLEMPDEREQRVAATVREYVEPDRVAMVDIGEKIESYSSSEVRERIAHADTIWTQMVTSSIAEYIKTQSLYLPSYDDKS